MAVKTSEKVRKEVKLNIVLGFGNRAERRRPTVSGSTNRASAVQRPLLVEFPQQLCCVHYGYLPRIVGKHYQKESLPRKLVYPKLPWKLVLGVCDDLAPGASPNRLRVQKIGWLLDNMIG